MNDKIIIALIGFGGVAIGALIQIFGNVTASYLQQRAKDRTDKKRKELLLTMLEDQRYSWRKLTTLMHVIGADEETTKRLLLELGARGSEDGQDLWGLIKRNPFKKSEEGGITDR